MKIVLILMFLCCSVFAAPSTPISNGRLVSPLNAGGNSVTNAADPVAGSDLATKQYVDGRATSPRLLPAYLHVLDFFDSYEDDAAWYYTLADIGGACSSVRVGNTYSRNFDFPYDDRAEFVVRMAAGPGRFASIGVAQVGTNLTEAIVTSGKPSPCYKWLPGATVDGINENGVVAEINVVDTDPPRLLGGDIHPLAAVRWALDNGTSAEMVATNLASRIMWPSGWAQNFHWMIADERETWIVENGTASNITGKVVMTNFPRLQPISSGMGIERYALLAGDANITNAWYTRAYLRTTDWASEFRDADEMDAAKAAWASLDTKAARRNRGFWQTVHTSVYDIANKVLRVAVQETDDWYTFALPASGGGIAEETDPVWTDEKVQYAKKTELPTKTSDLTNDSGFIADGEGEWQKHYTFADAASMTGFDSKILHAGDVLTVGEMFYVYGEDYGATWNVPFYFVRVSKGGPFDNISNFLFGGPGGYARAELVGDMRPATVDNLAAKLDKADRELHADSVTNVVWETCYSNGWVFLRAAGPKEEE